MRAGNLDRKITIQAFTSTQDEYGEPIETWTDFATVRAQLVQASADEYFAAAGVDAAVTIIFRTRYVAGVTTAHRVVYEGRNVNLDEVKEIGRQRGLELRGKAAE